MDSPDPRAGAVSSLVGVLRKVTRIVQVAPFAYLVLLAVYLLCESVLPNWAVMLADNLLNAPAYTTAGMLVLGRMLKLCAWFRTACLLPFTAKAECYVDAFVYQFTQNEVAIVNAATGILFIAFVFVTIRHFFHGHAAEA